MAISGIGPITATALVAAVGEAKEFKNGLHLAAWLGLVPQQARIIRVLLSSEEARRPTGAAARASSGTARLQREQPS